MSKINAEWHKAHRMPKDPTDRQRAEWHYDHARHCGCRAVTPSIAKLLRANGLEIPRRVDLPDRPQSDHSPEQVIERERARLLVPARR